MLPVEFKRQPAKFIKSLKVKDDFSRIWNKIDQLRIEPYPKEASRVEGYGDVKVFRVRVGNYRILYFIMDDALYIEKIDKRSRVYK